VLGHRSTTPVRRLDIGRLIGHLKCTSTAGHGLINIERLSDIVGGSSSASIEHSADVPQMVEAVAQMDQATQQNAAPV
jgi:hypothetical protein